MWHGVVCLPGAQGAVGGEVPCGSVPQLLEHGVNLRGRSRLRAAYPK